MTTTKTLLQVNDLYAQFTARPSFRNATLTGPRILHYVVVLAANLLGWMRVRLDPQLRNR